jgi:putative nucleotidyltransferase with HDIG domain
LSAILQAKTRTTDVVARYGGEEFVLILPETDTEGARYHAERLRQEIASASWANEAVTASFGIATLTLLMSTQADLVTEADKALYRSKHRGRNCVTHCVDADEDDALTLQSCQDLTRVILQGQNDFLLSAADQMRDMLIQSFDSTIASWSRILDLRDKETEGHSERVTAMMVRVTRHLGMNEEEIMFARWGAWLHDIGKIAVPDHILHKPGPLTEEEWVLMRQHPTVAYEMLRPIKFLASAIDIPYCHHEKWDGTGYPHGLKGDEIPLMARLFAVIDVYDALCSDRPYRAGWAVEKVRAYLNEHSGTHFEPHAVEVVLEVLDEERALPEVSTTVQVATARAA